LQEYITDGELGRAYCVVQRGACVDTHQFTSLKRSRASRPCAQTSKDSNLEDTRAYSVSSQ